MGTKNSQSKKTTRKAAKQTTKPTKTPVVENKTEIKIDMKKVSLIAVSSALVLVSGVLVACGFFDETGLGRSLSNVFGKSDVVYQASTRFLYSVDGGTSWSETKQEVEVGQTYYLAIEMQVSQSEETKEEKTVQATITIPNTNVLDVFLDDYPGVNVTGDYDTVNNNVSYDFNLVAGTSPNKFRVTFECEPLEEGRASVQVVYDDSVSDNWDATGTIKYVEAKD